MRIVSTAYGRKDNRHYNIALAVLGAVGAIGFVLLRILPPTVAAVQAPFAAGIACGFVFVGAYRFLLSRRYDTSLASLVRPLVLGFVYPVYLVALKLAFLLCERTGSAYSSEGALVLNMVRGVSAVALAMAVPMLAIAAIITGVMQYRAASLTHGFTISTLPLVLAIAGSIVSVVIAYNAEILALLTGV